MRRLLYAITFLLALSSSGASAQRGLSLGLGGGANFFFGSIDEEKMGYTGYFDTRYQFNEKFSVSLNYNYNHLEASRSIDGVTAYYFNSTVNNIDLHLGLDILQLAKLASPGAPLKLELDMGGGYSFFDEGLYFGPYFPTKEGQLSTTYKPSHGKGNTAKIHMGGQVAYSINPRFTIVAGILGHYYFTSDIDGYAHYANKPEKTTYNDVFFSTTLGIRYHIDNVILSSGNNNSKHKTHKGSYLNTKQKNIFQNFRFNRFLGKKSPQSSYEENKNRRVWPFFGKRWQGKKKAKNSIPKKPSNSRYQYTK